MTWNRIQAGSSDGLNTHSWSCFDQIWRETRPQDTHSVIVDPFARDCPYGGEWTNDLNPHTKAKHHLDALEFLKLIQSNYADMVIFDPPFSSTQEERKYGESSNIYTEPGRVSDLMFEIERILKPGGVLLKFGYNSTRHQSSFTFQQGWIINFGGNRNDVIATNWVMNQTSLLDYV